MENFKLLQLIQHRMLGEPEKMPLTMYQEWGARLNC